MNRANANIRWRYSLRTMLVAWLIVCLLLAYFGAYWQASRRGLREAAAYNMEGFYCAPLEEEIFHDDYRRHARLATLFAPANWLDQHLLGGPVVAEPICNMQLSS